MFGVAVVSICFVAFYSVDHEACQCLQCSVLMMSVFCLVVMSVSVAFSSVVTIRHLLCSVLMMSVCVDSGSAQC